MTTPTEKDVEYASMTDTVPITTSEVQKPAANASDVPMNYPIPPRTSTNAFAMTSMIWGIIGILMFGILLGTMAIIFGCVAIRQMDQRPQEFTGRGMANAGIICGIVGLTLHVLGLILVLTQMG
jgi:Domain of unknown function (DUF4190)